MFVATGVCPRLSLDVAVAPWRLSGQVYGALLNDPADLAALGDAIHQPPYKAPPAHPVLHVRPRNTLAGNGDAVIVPAAFEQLQTGATLALLIGQPVCRAAKEQAAAAIAGVALANDLRVPHDSHYRPAVRFRARDGFCPIGPRVAALTELGCALAALRLRVQVDGSAVQTIALDDWVRDAATLVADVSQFMTLHTGDLLMLGSHHGSPLVRAGQTVAIDAIDPQGQPVAALGCLSNPMLAQAF